MPLMSGYFYAYILGVGMIAGIYAAAGLVGGLVGGAVQAYFIILERGISIICQNFKSPLRPLGLSWRL
ncbi:hypothetical protein [Sporomusa sp. KB1]|uniref:hypothetical protein n=1 Tax=Sporomusa sp. KB1 TaxID=943346 RepID=UPI001C988324|nr:hypothetical protein [Sporomusa sp. KB1]